MNQQPYKQEFPISGIANGVCESGLSWKFFATNCEPFKQIKQLIPDACFVSSASRGVFLANDAQTPAVIFVPIRQLPQVLDLLTSATLQQTVPVILVVEDHPMVAPTIHPRRRLRESGVPTLEPSNALEAEFIGFAAGTIATSLGESVAIIAHHGLLGAASSSQERAGVDKVLGRLQGDTKDPIRLARRLELNRQRTLPSPGERGSVGFVTVGLSDASLRYLISELRLLGRVPALNLRLVSPIDCVPVQRLLTRCHNVVVLEPRPGEIESEILTIAEQMRREGEEVASVWGRELPQVDPGEPAIVVPVDFIHPSIVARLIKHLLHEAKPLSEVEHQLIPPRPSLPQRPTRRPHLGTAAALHTLASFAASAAKNFRHKTIILDGKQIQKGDEKTVSIETWGATRFDKEGRAVVQDLGGVSESRVFLVWTGTRQNAKPVFDASFLPTTKDDKSRLSHIAIDAADELAAELSQAIERAGVSVILVHEGEEPRFDTDRLSEVSKAIDSRGFLEKNIVTITMSEMSELRFHKPEATRPTKQTMPLETRIWSDWVPNEKSRLHLSLRPVLEQAMVVRVKPPVRVVSHTDARLTPPAPIHANAPQWRAHIAGTRGNQLGVVSQVLLSAAKQMGYETRVQTNTMIIGPGQRAWAQLLFTRPQTQRTERPLVGFIPWGEADLLLGWDQDESVRAIDPDGVLQVGSSQRTYAILNTGAVEQQTKTPSSMLGDQFIAGGQSPFLKKELGMVADFSAWARYRFHNTRLGDLVQLGVAFQQGLVPVTVDAMNTALREAEKEGFARSLEAFEYGRRIALHPEAAWLPVDEDQTVDLKRLIRRYVRNIRRVGLRGKKRSLVAKKLFDRVIKEMPGLSDSIEGRESLYSAIVCVRRCLLWGGEHTATQYVDSIVNVYKSDRVETRRKLTRSCVLLLAEAVLVPDPIYLARLARSPEIIRNLRQRLNVRKPRGDELHRRFLSRFELSVGKWRLRADIRTSDWSSALISNIGRIIPHRFRGRRRDREIRSLLMQATRIAAANPTSNQLWVKKFDSILEKSEGKTIQSMSVGTLREIIEGEMGYS